MRSWDFSVAVRKEKLERKISPGQPWLSAPGICVSARPLYGYGPKRRAKNSTARADASPTGCAFRAGEGGGGTTSIGGRGPTPGGRRFVPAASGAPFGKQTFPPGGAGGSPPNS